MPWRGPSPRAGAAGQGAPFPQLRLLGAKALEGSKRHRGCGPCFGEPCEGNQAGPHGLGRVPLSPVSPRGQHTVWEPLPSPKAVLLLSPQVSSRALPGPEEAADRGQETLERLLAWVADMEELVSNQKPPSAEAKVVKAQLEEQKVSGAGRRVPGMRGPGFKRPPRAVPR